MKLFRKKRHRKQAAVYLILAAAVVWTLFPFYWTMITSFKTSPEIAAKPVTYWPMKFTWENYVLSWQNSGFSTYFLNSLKVALLSTVFTVLFAAMDGYALARYQFKGKTLFLLALLCTQFFPTAMLMIPLFKIYHKAGLINHHWSLVLTYTVFHIPFNAALMRNFISGIPESLEEAAMVDDEGSWEIPNIMDVNPELADHVVQGMVPISDEPGKNKLQTATIYAAVYKDSPEVEEAKKFLNYLASSEYATTWNQEVMGNIPALGSVEVSENLNCLGQDVFALLQEGRTHEVMTPWTPDEVKDSLGEVWSLYVGRQIDREEFFKRYQEVWTNYAANK